MKCAANVQDGLTAYVSRYKEEEILRLIKRHGLTPPDWDDIDSVNKFGDSVGERFTKIARKARETEMAVAACLDEMSKIIGYSFDVCNQLCDGELL